MIILKYLFPTWNYVRHIFLVVTIAIAIYFAMEFLEPFVKNKEKNFWPLIFIILISYLIYLGSRSLSYKTRTIIWDRMTNKIVGFLRAGELKIVVPGLERTGINTEGDSDQTLNLKSHEIKIAETPKVLTNAPGVLATLFGFSAMISFDERNEREFQRMLKYVVNMNGGIALAFKRTEERIPQIIHDRVGNIKPEDLDRDKGDEIVKLAENIKRDLNRFFRVSKYPFIIEDPITIKDTELDLKYYETLMKQEIARVEALADDTTAEALGTRLRKLGAELLKNIKGLPKYTSAQRTEVAMIALQKIKKDITFKKVGIDKDSEPIFFEMARILGEILGRKTP